MVLSALRQQGAPHEILVTPDAAVECAADRIRCGLARQIDLQGAVDGDHVVLPGDVEGIVRIIDGPEENGGIVVEKFVGCLLPHGKGGDGLSRVQGFSGSCR